MLVSRVICRRCCCSWLVGPIYKLWVNKIFLFFFPLRAEYYPLLSHAIKVVSLVLSVAECFAFLICTKWYNPAIHRRPNLTAASSSTSSIRYLNWNNGILVSSEDVNQEHTMCSLQDIGGHVMKVPFICFQIMLFMYLEVYLSKRILVYLLIDSFMNYPHC